MPFLSGMTSLFIFSSGDTVGVHYMEGSDSTPIFDNYNSYNGFAGFKL